MADESDSLIPNPLDYIGGWKGKVLQIGKQQVEQIVDEEFNQKRLIFTITIKNHYEIYNRQLNERFIGFKSCCWKYVCCGLWSCMNCCCSKRCLCSCFCLISTDLKITKDISKKLSEQLNKEEIKHTITILNDTDFEITLLHVSKSWLEKMEELAVEHFVPNRVRNQIDHILRGYGVEASIVFDRRKVDANIIQNEDVLDDQYL